MIRTVLRLIAAATFLFVLASCSDSGEDVSPDDAASPTTTSTTTTSATAGVADAATPAETSDGATNTTEQGPAPEEPAEPIELSIEHLDLIDGHALVAELRVAATASTPLEIVIDGPGDPAPLYSADAVDHRIAVVGLRADAEYDITVVAADGSSTGGSLRTGPLPDDLPQFRAISHEDGGAAPGLTLFNVLNIGATISGDPIDQAGMLLMVDAEGEIVWYHRTTHPIGDVRLLEDGTILHEYDDMAARRIDLFGETLDEWAGRLVLDRLAVDSAGRRVVGVDPIRIDTDSMHHEHTVLADGRHVVLSTELRVIDGFDAPRCGEEPEDFDGSYSLIGDVIVVFDPADGSIDHEFSLFDHIDPLRPELGASVCGLTQPFVFPNWMYQPVDPRARDWTHANAVVHDEDRNALIVSVRHQHALMALRLDDDEDGPAGELLWWTGPFGDVELVGEGEWHYMQHAPQVLDDGTILLYDNGATRPGYANPFFPDLPPPYSRAVIYDIDEETKTARQLWEYRPTLDDAQVFSAVVSDADSLPGGNVLITSGALLGTPDGLATQILEVRPEADGGTPVWELRMDDGATYLVYRAERVAPWSAP